MLSCVVSFSVDIVTGSQNSLKLQETGTAIQELLDQVIYIIIFNDLHV